MSKIILCLCNLLVILLSVTYLYSGEIQNTKGDTSKTNKLIHPDRFEYSTTGIDTDIYVNFNILGEFMFLNLDQNNDAFKAYGLSTIDSKLLMTYGLKASVQLKQMYQLGLIIIFGTQSSPMKDNPAFTTDTYAIMFGLTGGYEFPYNLQLNLDAGYGYLITGMMGKDRGGMLIHQGPFVRPRVTYVILDRLINCAVSLGYYLQIPMGRAHNIVYMDEPFNRPTINGFTISIELGFANRLLFD